MAADFVRPGFVSLELVDLASASFVVVVPAEMSEAVQVAAAPAVAVDQLDLGAVSFAVVVALPVEMTEAVVQEAVAQVDLKSVGFVVAFAAVLPTGAAAIAQEAVGLAAAVQAVA